MSNDQTKRERWKSQATTILAVIGGITVLRFLLTVGSPTYTVKLTLENLAVGAEQEPHLYLVERRWLFSTTQYPLRFRIESELYDWQYERNGEWISLPSSIGDQVDAHYEPDSSDPNDEGW